MPKSLAEPKDFLQVKVSESVMLKTRLLLMDPARQRPRHGALSDLVEALLRKWLIDQGVQL